MLSVGLARRRLQNYDSLLLAGRPRGIPIENRVAFLAIFVTILPLGTQERASRQLAAADYARAKRTLGDQSRLLLTRS